MNDYTKKIKEDVVLPDLDANVDLLDLVDGGYDDDYYEAFHIYDKNDKKDQINESVSDLGTVVKDSYNHFVYDLGRTPTVDDIFDDVRDNYEGYSDIDDTPEKTSEWYDIIANELSYQGLDVSSDDVFKEALKVLEESEDEVECAECGELVEKVRCTKNEDGRYVCDVCKECK